MIRVLVVDDSATARELITTILNSDSQIEVVGEAVDGLIGVEMTAELRPDVVTMDINMPRMDGHQATKRIMATTPTPIVVVTTVSRDEMVHEGFDILLAGGMEIVQKPSALTSQAYETIAEELVVKVKAISQVRATALAG